MSAPTKMKLTQSQGDLLLLAKHHYGPYDPMNLCSILTIMVKEAFALEAQDQMELVTLPFGRTAQIPKRRVDREAMLNLLLQAMSTFQVPAGQVTYQLSKALLEGHGGFYVAIEEMLGFLMRLQVVAANGHELYDFPKPRAEMLERIELARQTTRHITT